MKLDEHKRLHYIWIFGHISDFSKHFSKKTLTLWIPVHCQVMILRQLLLSKVWNISLSSFLRSLALKRWLELSGDRILDTQIFVFCKQGWFSSSFLVYMSFISFSCRTALAKTSIMMLNKEETRFREWDVLGFGLNCH